MYWGLAPQGWSSMDRACNGDQTSLESYDWLCLWSSSITLIILKPASFERLLMTPTLEIGQNLANVICFRKMEGFTFGANQEKDVGVIISNTLKLSAHCAKAANKAKQVLRQMSHGFFDRDKYTLIYLYCQFCRPYNSLRNCGIAAILLQKKVW